MSDKPLVYENALSGDTGAPIREPSMADDDPWPNTELRNRLAEIDARLEEQRPNLMPLLRKAARNCKFDGDTVWRHVKLVGGAYVGHMDYVKSAGADSGASLDQIANAAHTLADCFKECRVNLSGVWHSSITGSPLRDDELAIWMVTPPAASAARELEEFAERVRKINAAMRGRRRRGRKDELPGGIIIHLARIYEQATGKRPGGSKGLFQRMVNTFLEGVGRPMSIDHVVKRIRAALKQG